MKAAGAVIAAAPAAGSSLAAALQLGNILNCRRSDEALAVLSNNEALSAIYGGKVSYSKPVPNIETAFSIRIVSTLTNCLLSAEYSAAADVALAVSALPELHDLHDKAVVDDFNARFTEKLNPVYNFSLLPLMQIR